MSDPNLTVQRQIQELQDALERLRKADAVLYTVGAWTPIFTGSGTAGTFTYAGQAGVWTRVGDQLIIHGYVQISAISVAPTGVMQIGGLPFAAASVGMDFSVSLGFVSNINTSANVIQITALIGLGGAGIALYEVFDNAVTVAFPAGNFTNTAAGIELSGVYQV